MNVWGHLHGWWLRRHPELVKWEPDPTWRLWQHYDGTSPYDQPRVEVMRREWPMPRVVSPLDVKLSDNKAGLYWRPVADASK